MVPLLWDLADRVILQRIIPEREDCPGGAPPSHHLLQGFLDRPDDRFFRLSAGPLKNVPDPALDTVTLIGNVVGQHCRDHEHEHERARLEMELLRLAAGQPGGVEDQNHGRHHQHLVATVKQRAFGQQKIEKEQRQRGFTASRGQDQQDRE